MATTGLQLRSQVNEDNTLELSLEEVTFPEPGPSGSRRHRSTPLILPCWSGRQTSPPPGPAAPRNDPSSPRTFRRT